MGTRRDREQGSMSRQLAQEIGVWLNSYHVRARMRYLGRVYSVTDGGGGEKGSVSLYVLYPDEIVSIRLSSANNSYFSRSNRAFRGNRSEL